MKGHFQQLRLFLVSPDIGFASRVQAEHSQPNNRLYVYLCAGVILRTASRIKHTGAQATKDPRIYVDSEVEAAAAAPAA